MTMIRNWIRQSSLYDTARRAQARWQYIRWRLTGESTVPPPHLVKQRIIREYAKRHGATVLVETGTYLGDMMHAMRNDFVTLHSIELSKELFARAKLRFADRNQIHLHQGDSAAVLPTVLGLLDGPTLFWLDGHYSAGVTAKGAKDTPVAEELSQIFARPETARVILIDDARCFTGSGDYPTLDEVRRMVRAHRPDWVVEVAHDVIRAHPPAKVQ
jgi:hypothetical protein